MIAMMKRRLIDARDNAENVFISLSSSLCFEDARIVEVHDETVLIRFEVNDEKKVFTHEAFIKISAIDSVGIDVSSLSYNLEVTN